MRKAILLEALNATPFMVDANQQVLSYCFDFGAERCERCGAAHPVADCPQHEVDPRLAVLGRLLPPVEGKPKREG
mgnify:CR=1 FL=1